MKQIEAETQQELNAILPSILDKAFIGELQAFWDVRAERAWKH